jgi:formylglycine-generating enzyme required for sulfatase activity
MKATRLLLTLSALLFSVAASARAEITSWNAYNDFYLSPLRRLATAALVALILASLAVPHAHAVTIEMATVGNPGNAADTTGYGRVDYAYGIGKTHITIEQYCEFLNAVAKTDTYGLYDDGVNWAPVSGISRTGSPGSYVYTPTAPVGPSNPGITAGNRPITKLTWFSAARFANWMANGQPTGSQIASTTERGAYQLEGRTTGAQVARSAVNPNTGAMPTFVIPTENEWYKAAYYKGGSTNAGYWNYATQSDTPPGNDLSTSGSNVANFNWNGDNPAGLANAHSGYTINANDGWDFALNHLTAVGMFAGTTTAYGVYDMSGNARSWLETPVNPFDIEGTYVRGGTWDQGENVTQYRRDGLNNRFYTANNESSPNIGIRLGTMAVAVPEPSTYAMALAGVAYGGFSMFRRRKRA